MAKVKKFISRCWISKKQAFSLIEVLVAMTILSVIVLIVAGIFQIRFADEFGIGSDRTRTDERLGAAGDYH